MIRIYVADEIRISLYSVFRQNCHRFTSFWFIVFWLRLYNQIGVLTNNETRCILLARAHLMIT